MLKVFAPKQRENRSKENYFTLIIFCELKKKKFYIKTNKLQYYYLQRCVRVCMWRIQRDKNRFFFSVVRLVKFSNNIFQKATTVSVSVTQTQSLKINPPPQTKKPSLSFYGPSFLIDIICAVKNSSTIPSQWGTPLFDRGGGNLVFIFLRQPLPPPDHMAVLSIFFTIVVSFYWIFFQSKTNSHFNNENRNNIKYGANKTDVVSCIIGVNWPM